jgi:hypothetical protein
MSENGFSAHIESYMVPITELQHACVCADTEYSDVLQHRNTLFVLLLER